MIVLLVALAAVLTGAVDAEIPLEFTSAVNSGEPRDILSISNYGAGASMTEAYTDIDQLSRETQVSTRSYGPGPASPAGGLEASISSQVIGRAHISWQSADMETVKGRHPITGRSIEDLTGVFTIEKFIQLWSGSQPGQVSVDWLPCS